VEKKNGGNSFTPPIGTDKDITTGKPRGTIKVNDILEIGGRKWIVTGIMAGLGFAAFFFQSVKFKG
jgi:hypothetical protein